MIRFELKCEHGTRVVEFPNEEPPSTAYAIDRLFALQPRCPYCDPLDAEATMEGPSVEKRVRAVRDAQGDVPGVLRALFSAGPRIKPAEDWLHDAVRAWTNAHGQIPFAGEGGATVTPFGTLTRTRIDL